MSINEYFCPVLRLIHFSQNFKIQFVITWTWLQFLSLRLRWDSEQGIKWGCEGHVLLQAVFVQCKWHKDKICTTLSIDHYSKINVGIHFFSFLFCSSLPPAKSAQIFSIFISLPFFFFVITKMEEKICIVLSISNSFILLYFQRTFAFVALNLPSTDFHLMYHSFISCYLSYIVCVFGC